jgi:tetratricopeptide (TPR) repeat protein
LLGELCTELQIPLTTGPDESADARGRRVLAELKRRALEAAPRDPDKGAACLVILDNVSEPALVAEPQMAQIPREDWLRVVVTTREGPEKFPASRKKSLTFIAVDALNEEDATRLIEDHQLDGQWPAATATADAAAARQIARELGGFTLAVESVAIYLGLHPDIRPTHYLARLRAEGLTGVDALPADTDVAAQMQHREKQLRLVLDQTLARLTPAERTALDCAALLPPDNIPWLWLRALVAQEHPEFAFGVPPLGGWAGEPAEAQTPDESTSPPPEGGTSNRPGYPAPWPALRRRLEGLRLLTPGDHVGIARLHRMVAAHVRELMNPEGVKARRNALENFLHQFTGYFEQQAQHSVEVLWLLKPLQETILFLAADGADLRMGENAGVVGTIEMQMGRMDRALMFIELAKEVCESAATENPNSAQAARDVSVSLDRLADFLASRGLPGDAEKALGHYQRCHEVLERLLVANPNSAQAARDVSVSLNKLADFLASRGLQGDAEKALGHYQRSLEVRERLLVANPNSAQAARDVSVSLERLAAFAGGRAGGENKALEMQTRSLGIALKLREQNPTSLFYQRTAAVSYIQTYQRAQAAEQRELAAQCLAGCFSVLDPLVQARVELDPPMRQLHAQLKPMFSDSQ